MERGFSLQLCSLFCPVLSQFCWWWCVFFRHTLDTSENYETELRNGTGKKQTTNSRFGMRRSGRLVLVCSIWYVFPGFGTSVSTGEMKIITINTPCSHKVDKQIKLRLRLIFVERECLTFTRSTNLVVDKKLEALNHFYLGLILVLNLFQYSGWLVEA